MDSMPLQMNMPNDYGYMDEESKDVTNMDTSSASSLTVKSNANPSYDDSHNVEDEIQIPKDFQESEVEPGCSDTSSTGKHRQADNNFATRPQFLEVNSLDSFSPKDQGGEFESDRQSIVPSSSTVDAAVTSSEPSVPAPSPLATKRARTSGSTTDQRSVLPEQPGAWTCSHEPRSLVKETLEETSIPPTSTIDGKALSTTSVSVPKHFRADTGGVGLNDSYLGGRPLYPTTAIVLPTSSTNWTDNTFLGSGSGLSGSFGSLFDDVFSADAMENVSTGHRSGQATGLTASGQLSTSSTIATVPNSNPQWPIRTNQGEQRPVLRPMASANASELAPRSAYTSSAMLISSHNNIHSKEVIETLSGMKHDTSTLQSSSEYGQLPSDSARARNSGRNRSHKRSRRSDGDVEIDPEKQVVFEEPPNFSPHQNVPENYLTELKLAKGTRRLKPEQVAILKYWMADAKNWPHPYPDESEKRLLAEKCNMSVTQVSDWFRNERKRVWLPLQRGNSSSSSKECLTKKADTKKSKKGKGKHSTTAQLGTAGGNDVRDWGSFAQQQSAPWEPNLVNDTLGMQRERNAPVDVSHNTQHNFSAPYSHYVGSHLQPSHCGPLGVSIPNTTSMLGMPSVYGSGENRSIPDTQSGYYTYSSAHMFEPVERGSSASWANAGAVSSTSQSVPHSQSFASSSSHSGTNK